MDSYNSSRKNSEAHGVEGAVPSATALPRPRLWLGHGLSNGFEERDATYDNAPDLVCLSHLRWNFVFQRPQHLMTRCARERRVFYFEEPVFSDDPEMRLEMNMDTSGVCVAVPRLPHGLPVETVVESQRELLEHMFDRCGIHDFISWYYTPMAIPFTRHLRPLATVYDCMDELSAFRGAHMAMRDNEAELLALADVVFTGGLSLYEAKRTRHPNVHAFPSSIDVDHFAQARRPCEDPPDQRDIPAPRLGFAGVIDERMDLELLGTVAAKRPEWHFVMIGPVVKIDPAALPKSPNIHYLGGRGYDTLPTYMAGWDVAVLPFAMNESTRYISPTKTPEYLAAGRPVVSTPIHDVVRGYGARGLVRIAATPDEFVSETESLLKRRPSAAWWAEADKALAQSSWNRTWAAMMEQLDATIARRSRARTRRTSMTAGMIQPARAQEAISTPVAE